MNNNEIAGSIEVRIGADRIGAVKYVILHTVLKLKKNDKVKLGGYDAGAAEFFTPGTISYGP